jgi:putative membrane-bound dehydrogenase-like protein
MRILALSLILSTTALGLTLEEAAKIAPLPDLAKQGGVVFADLNEDGHEDLIISNSSGYGVFIFNPVEKKNVQWDRGWSNVLREGRAGDANSLPFLDGATFRDGTLITADGKTRLTKSELLRVPGPAPLSPQDSLKTMRAKPGWSISLVAHEPLVQDPVFIDWDEQGRAWVVEMGDYPFAPGEKTNDGKISQGKVSDLQAGRIKVLTDTDGDGVYDKSSLFLDGLLHPTGLICWKGGVFVSGIPDIFYARDTDGDGRCDERETWFSGFTAGNPQHLINGFCWGLDGWIYGANGDSGGNVIVEKTKEKIKLGTNDFRFHPITGKFERELGRTQYGKWRDDFGNWFGNNNSTIAWHYFLPMRWMEAHPDKIAATVRAVTNEDKTVYPISPPVRRFNWAAAVNTLTSGCSPIPWFDGQDHALLICEPANNLVHREQLDLTALPITSRRHPEDKDSEFLASADNWFRPSMARPGPDGAIYVVDMYRLVLEHPEWIPTAIVRGLDVRAGEDKGRIYRLSGPTSTKSEVALLANPVTALRSAHRWTRDTAQRLILEKQDKAAVPALVEIVSDAKASLNVRLQAAWTAALLDEAQRAALIALMKSHFPQVRGASLVAAGSDDIHPDELASWFPKPRDQKPVAAVPVITNTNADRQKIVKRYVSEVGALRGDAGKGQTVFAKACMACHKLGGQGVEVGPDLATIATKPADQILEAIFDPNRAVEMRNAATQITRTDGTTIAGLISAETPASISLRLPGGVDMPIPRASIREMKTLTTSLMPEGLESVITPQEAADLLARITGR